MNDERLSTSKSYYPNFFVGREKGFFLFDSVFGRNDPQGIKAVINSKDELVAVDMTKNSTDFYHWNNHACVNT